MQVSDAVNLSPQSEYAKEMRKWEMNHTKWGPPGREYRYEAYPTRMYKASRPEKGGPPLFEGADARDESERSRLERQGFTYGGQALALEALEKREFEIAELAANRIYNERRMSEKAKAEIETVEASTIKHLPEIPETPIKRKRGRPAKVTVTA